MHCSRRILPKTVFRKFGRSKGTQSLIAKRERGSQFTDCDKDLPSAICFSSLVIPRTVRIAPENTFLLSRSLDNMARFSDTISYFTALIKFHQ